MMVRVRKNGDFYCTTHMHSTNYTVVRCSSVLW